MESTAAAVPAVSPWIGIWTRPRATMRLILQTDPAPDAVVLAILGGTAQVLTQLVSENTDELFSVAGILTISLLVGAAVGIVGLYLGSALACWTERWIGGEGSMAAIRKAFGWANVPLIAMLALWLALLSVLGPAPFRAAAVPVGGGPALLLALLATATVVLSIWSFVLLLKLLGEVQGFSAWKAWGNLILSSAPFVALGVLAAVLAALLS